MDSSVAEERGELWSPTGMDTDYMSSPLISSSVTLGKACCLSEPWYSHSLSRLIILIIFLTQFLVCGSFESLKSMLITMHKYRSLFIF